MHFILYIIFQAFNQKPIKKNRNACSFLGFGLQKYVCSAPLDFFEVVIGCSLVVEKALHSLCLSLALSLSLPQSPWAIYHLKIMRLANEKKRENQE